MAVRSILRQLQVAGVAKIPDGDFGNSRKDHFVVELTHGHASLASFCSCRGASSELPDLHLPEHSVHVVTESFMQNFGAIDLPHFAKCRALRDCPHINGPSFEVILGQLAVAMAEPGDLK